MTRIKRKTFIIKRFTRITEQTYLQKNKILRHFSYQTVSRHVSETTAGNQIFTDRNKADLYSLFINVLHAKGRFSKEYFLQPKKERYESGKIQGAALPEKERAGQDRTKAPGSWDGSPLKPHDGAVQLQALLYPRAMERA